MGLKLRGSLSEDLANSFPQLQLGLGPCSIPIGKPFLVAVVDGCEDFRKLRDTADDLLDHRGF